MYKGYQIEQKRNEKSGGRETTVSQMMKIVGNQAMIQMDPGKKKRARKENEKPRKKRKAYDDDDDFILDMELVKQEEEEEMECMIAMIKEDEYSPENLPKKYIYIPEDKDCFKGKFDYSKVHIHMTGKRTDDNAEADRILSGREKSYTHRPKNFTWHHMASNIIEECDMVLVNTEQHSKIKHIGAVHQYVCYKRKNENAGFRYK